MKRVGRRGAALALCGLALAGGAVAAGVSGGESLISLSYLTRTFVPQTVSEGTEQAREELDQVYDRAAGELSDLARDYLAQAGAGTEGGQGGADSSSSAQNPSGSQAA